MQYMTDVLKKYDAPFICNNSHGDEQSSEVFRFEDRQSRLILSAPHATRSFCNKKEKCADLYTGALVRFVGAEKDVSTLVRVKYTPHKELISDFIFCHHLEAHCFLDIHGFNRDIDYDVCLGIGDFSEEGYPYLAQIVETARKYGLKTIVNHPNYSGRYGLTGRFQKAVGRPDVIQMEIKKYLRDFYNYPEQVQNVTLPFLCEVTECYK